jgi:hypothetical protein
MSKVFTRLSLGDVVYSSDGKCFKRLGTGWVAGLYDAAGNLVASWGTLIDTYGMDVKKNYDDTTYKTDSSSPYYVLTNNASLASGVKMVVGAGVTSIGYYAFRDCANITSVELPNSVTSINDGAFYKCTSLDEVALGNNVKSIGAGAFMDCTSLEGIAIPDSVTSIGNGAFMNCTRLTNIVIGNGLKNVGTTAFYGCTGLSDVYYMGTEEEWEVITIASNNTPLTTATIHFNYVPWEPPVLENNILKITSAYYAEVVGGVLKVT